MYGLGCISIVIQISASFFKVSLVWSFHVLVCANPHLPNTLKRSSEIILSYMSCRLKCQKLSHPYSCALPHYIVLLFSKDVDVELRIVCEQFIQNVSESLISPLSAFLTKVLNIIRII